MWGFGYDFFFKDVCVVCVCGSCEIVDVRENVYLLLFAFVCLGVFAC